MKPTLPAELRSLAGRLATERVRPELWRIAADLRGQLRDRLERGEDAETLVEELRRAIEAAVAAQRAGAVRARD